MLILLPNPFLDSSAEAYSNMYNKLHINEWKSIQPGLYIMHAETINCGKIEPCNKSSSVFGQDDSPSAFRNPLSRAPLVQKVSRSKPNVYSSSVIFFMSRYCVKDAMIGILVVLAYLIQGNSYKYT